jgi:preprotein translocase subunit SecE
VATASGEANGAPVEPPEPLAHAAPDAELAEAQLSAGRPRRDEVPDEDALADLEQEAEEEGQAIAGHPGAAAAVAVPARHVEREALPQRTATFLRGSWRELQRVQWPDRRQVMQATSVVIGFVIVAGVFLGVADVVAQKIVNLILYGHG